MNMLSLYRDTTDAQRVVALERQRFWLIVALILFVLLCAMLWIERTKVPTSDLCRPSSVFRPPSSPHLPLSPSSAQRGRTAENHAAAPMTAAENSRDKNGARGLAVASPAGAETFAEPITVNGRRILAVVVPFEDVNHGDTEARSP